MGMSDWILGMEEEAAAEHAHATRLETIEECAKVAETLAWSNSATPMLGPEQNCLRVASAIRQLAESKS